MNLQIIGCSHHQSDTSVREQLAFSAQQVKPFLEKFYDRYPRSEAVLLSTCNRTEFYTVGKEESQQPSPREMVDFLAEASGLDTSQIEDCLFTHQNRQAVKHLFSVTASLDSMVIGETQILAQVKQAYQLAVESKSTLSLTHQVFQNAIRVAKRVSNETGIHDRRISVPSVAIGVLAKQIFERLSDKRILIIGAGKMATETLNYIKSEGGKDIVIVNRTMQHATNLADKFDAQVSPWTQLSQELAIADLIVSTTGASEPIVSTEMFDAIEPSRQQRPLLILDLSIPRDFDNPIGDRLNVYLYTLDDLQKKCEHNLGLRKKQLMKAETILEQETDQFLQETSRRSSGNTIAQLKLQANLAKEAELKRLMNKIDLEPKQREEVEQSFHRLVNKILHPPLKSIQNHTKTDSHHGLIDALKRLFQLGD